MYASFNFILNFMISDDDDDGEDDGDDDDDDADDYDDGDDHDDDCCFGELPHGLGRLQRINPHL